MFIPVFGESIAMAIRRFFVMRSEFYQLQLFRLNRFNKFSLKTYSSVHSSEKISTGITGLSADRFARKTLLRLCHEIKDELGGFPENYAYRTGLLALTNNRISLLENCEHSDVDVECLIDGGQLEELVEQAHEELVLLDKIKNEWKPWERAGGDI